MIAFTYLPLLALFSVFWSASAQVSPLPIPPAPPAFYHLLSGTASITPDLITIPGPIGVRVSVGFAAGLFKDHNGKTIGKVVAGHGGEHGVVSTTGLLNLDVRMTVALTDGTYAYFASQGKGVTGTSNIGYWYCETNSKTYAKWNSMFLIGQSAFNGTTATFNVWSDTQPVYPA